LSVTLRRKTNGGVPVRIEINEYGIQAYREEPARILQHTFDKDGGERIEVEPELSRYFTNEPVMRISKRANGIDFTVDFDAGFQRGRITVGRDELVKRSHWPKSGPGYLKWIGLSAKDLEVREFLKGYSEAKL